MSTFKSSIKIESTSIFPTPINYTASATNTVSGDSNFGKLNLVHNTITPISISELSGKGLYLYVSSPTTNPASAGIEILGSNDAVIATVFPGESGFIPVPVEQGKLRARTTWGNATLDYFIAARGNTAGQSAVIYDYDSAESGANWKYFLLDVASCTPTAEVDTGFPIADWQFYTESIVQDKGYIFRFYNIADGYNIYYFVGPDGKNVDTFNGDGAVFSVYNCNRFNYMIKYSDGDYTRIKTFDGERSYDHSFYNASDVILDSDWEDCASNGTIPIMVQGENGIVGQETIYFLNGSRKTKVVDYNADATLSYYTSYVSVFNNFAVLAKYDYDNDLYMAFEIYDLSGSLLKKLTLSPSDNITDWDYSFCGSDSFQAILYNNIDTNVDYIMFNYNQKTGKMIGDDKSWRHARGINYQTFNLYADNYDINDRSDYNKNAAAVAFYSLVGTDTDRLASDEVTYLDIHYIIDDGDLRKYTVTEDNSLYVNLRSGVDPRGSKPSNNGIQFLTSADEFAGPLLSLSLTKTAAPTTFTAIADLVNVYSGEGFDFFVTGDYQILGYWGATYTKYSVLGPVGIYDTLTINEDFQDNISTNKNSIFYRYYGDELNYYFNAATKKWTSLATFYSDTYRLNFGTLRNGVEPGVIAILKPEFYAPLNTIKARVLNNGVITNEIDITPENYSAWEVEVTDTHFIFVYNDPTNYSYWQINTYDLQLNKLYSINTESNGEGYSSWRAGKRALLQFAKPGAVDDFYLLSGLINYKPVTYSIYSPNIAFNDAEWYND
jgi:hypothetical protein